MKMSQCEVVAAEITLPGSGKTKFICEMCKLSFASKGNLNIHLRRFHQLKIETEQGLACSLCGKKYPQMPKLQEHIQNEHSIALQFSTETFYSVKDFQDWKVKMETESQSFYRVRNVIKTNSVHTTYYACHRSGSYKFRENRTRNVKASGSIKTGNTCPAFIKVSTETVDGISEINVQHQSVHLGHDFDTRTLNLTKKDRENLAACLKIGIPMDKILEDAKRNVSPTSRYSLLTRKHLHNIRRTIGNQPNDGKSQNMTVSQRADAEGSDSSDGFRDDHEVDVSDQVEIQPLEIKEQEQNTAVSSILSPPELSPEVSDEFKNRKVQIVNQLKELQSRIEEWDPNCTLPEVEDHIKAINARLDFCSAAGSASCTPGTLPIFEQKKSTAKRRKTKTKEVINKNQPN